MQKAPDAIPLPSRIHLQAIDPARNIARDYRIEAGIDLFGHIIITLHWGRIGTRGRSRTISFAKAQTAARFLRAIIRRRKRARRRIGVAYLPAKAAQF